MHSSSKPVRFYQDPSHLPRSHSSGYYIVKPAISTHSSGTCAQKRSKNENVRKRTSNRTRKTIFYALTLRKPSIRMKRTPSVFHPAGKPAVLLWSLSRCKMQWCSMKIFIRKKTNSNQNKEVFSFPQAAKIPAEKMRKNPKTFHSKE